MIVVLDSNIWLKELALNSGAGSALRFFLKHRPARLAVPEVVRLEVQKNLRSNIEAAIESVAKGHRQLLAHFGSMKEMVLPMNSEVDSLVSDVFDRVGVEIMDIPFSLASARSAFLKTVYMTQPCDIKQEFKDAVLWADCLELLDQDDVLLATQDKAFCSNHQLGRGLAENLLAESSSKPNKIALVHSVADVLKHVKMEVRLEGRWLIAAIQQRGHSAVSELLSRGAAEVSGSGEIQYDLFATEIPDVLYMTYVIEIPCADIGEMERSNLRLTLKGSGTIRPGVPEVLGVSAGEDCLSFVSADGTPGEVRNGYMSGSLALGHRTITHSVRFKLNGGE